MILKDVVFNYKTTSVEDVLKEHGLMDIFWDHVGGKTTSTVLEHMNTFGRVVVIGAISGYNTAAGPEPVTAFMQILTKRLTVRGLLMTEHDAAYGKEFFATIPPRIARGELMYTEAIVRTRHNAPQLMLDVHKGDNAGKAVVILADE